jgi:hypothetical protein
MKDIDFYFFKYEEADINILQLFQARNYIQTLPVLKKKDFKEVFKGANPLGRSSNY